MVTCGRLVVPVAVLGWAVFAGCAEEQEGPPSDDFTFHTGMEADLLLSGIDFNDTGGPLLFNHPGLVSTDGEHLVLADRNNNRVLIWSELPMENVAPDIVLGQKDFYTNAPGTTLDKMNWPVSAVLDGTHLLVTDAYNDRVLIWNRFPEENGAPADLAIAAPWPWGVWSDGQRLVVSGTREGVVFVWNTFPTRNDEPPDIELTGDGDIGTPRTITSDGNRLIIGDHNPGSRASPTLAQGCFVWTRFPTTDGAPYDLFMTDPMDPARAILQGTFDAQGRLIMLGSELYAWDSFLAPDDLEPDARLPESVYAFSGGDGSGVAWTEQATYVSVNNGNFIAGYFGDPFSPPRPPDFSVGAPDPYTNTLREHGLINNPRPATDGKHLFVSSDFDGTLSVWREIPTESGQAPDVTCELNKDASPWSIALHDDHLVLVGGNMLLAWNHLPLGGEQPDTEYRDQVGGVSLRDVGGVTMDDQGFYLADTSGDRILVWPSFPDQDTPPTYVIPATRPVRLSSDGSYLVATSVDDQSVTIFEVGRLSEGGFPVVVGKADETQSGLFALNRPEDAIVSHGHLFIADTGFNRVLLWEDIRDAVAGIPCTAILGQEDCVHTDPAIGRDRLFWPAALAYDGRYLWVGEYKFSSRLVRFSG